jgi:hypothetical protein
VVVGLPPFYLLGTHEKRIALLMAWTLTDDDDGKDVINVRAVISTVHQQDQLRNLIAALEKRLTKEKPDERRDS